MSKPRSPAFYLNPSMLLLFPSTGLEPLAQSKNVHKMQKTPKTSKITKREKFEEFRLAERQFHEFGFTCNGFINMYRSILIENWTFVLDEFALKQINQKMHFSESTDTKQFNSLLDRLASRILYNGRLDLILGQAKSHLNDFLLNVVDVKDEDDAPSYDDEAEIMREIEQLEGEILTLRALQ
uniref:Translin n=1 Tax=Globodera pallida TaxID=36090 RepID=A0A183BHY8_GLOPA